MADYDNTNRGAIWKNDNKEKETQPDFRGVLNVDGVDFNVSAWKRKPGASDGELREYDIESLSEDAKNKIAVLNFFSGNVMPILTEVIRLVQLGNQVDQGQLTRSLPEKYTVVQQAENVVESDNTDGEDSSK